MTAVDLFKFNNDSIRNLHSTWVTFFIFFLYLVQHNTSFYGSYRDR